MKVFVIFLVLASFLGITFAEDTPQQPEPTPSCPEGTVVQGDVCVETDQKCGKGTELVNGLCYVIRTDHNKEMEFYSMVALFNMSMTPVFFTASLIYWQFGKKYKKIIVTLLFAITILWTLGLMTNVIPIAFG